MMLETILYTLISVILVSLVSFAGIITLVLRIKNTERWLLFLVSISAGTLLGGSFFHLLPEIVEEQGFKTSISVMILLGIIVFFLLEKFVHFHHKKKHHTPIHSQVHSHAYELGPINLVGDGLHNFLDGLIIAASYIISIPLGITTTIAVLLHEIPQEIADFGVLIYSGMKKKKALLMNFLSAAVSIIGAITGLLINSESFVNITIPLVVGGFIYIAGSNLIPQLHRNNTLKNSLMQISGIVLGIVLMYALLFLE